LCQTMGLAMSAAQIAQLARRAEGWLAGLKLSALALREAHDSAASALALAGHHHVVFEYLADEVLSQQPPDIQRMLLCTAVPDRLCDSLCAALLAGEAASPTPMPGLASLERTNLPLVALDGERYWYRYHSIFADLLRSQLRRRFPDQVRGLHQRAARWFATHGLVDEAIRHAFAGSDSSLAVELVVAEGRRRLDCGDLATLRGWLVALPEQLVATNPQLILLRAWTLVASDQVAAVEPLLASLDLATLPGLAPEVLALRAFVASSRSQWANLAQLARQALQAARAAALPYGFIYAGLGDLAWLSEDAQGALEAYRYALECACQHGYHIQLFDATHTLAQFALLQGQISAAEAICAYGASQLALQGAAAAPYAELLSLNRAIILCERHDLAAARAAAEQCLHIAGHCNITSYEPSIHAALARISAAQNDTALARRALSALQQAAQRTLGQPSYRSAIWAALLQLREVDVALSLGDLASAVRWAVQHWTPPDPQARVDRLLRQYALAHVLVACCGQPALLNQLAAHTGAPPTWLAGQMISSCTQRFGAWGLGALLIDLHTLSAVLSAALGDQRQALEALLRAITLAAPEGIVQPFISRGAPMQRLLLVALNAWNAPSGDPTAQRYAARLLELFPQQFVTCLLNQTCIAPPSAPPDRTRTSEPLSARERDVLPLLAAGLSHREIAAALTIAPDTARTHIKNIYSKLQVQNRVQAISQARALGLI
ncbi:MAG: hypothetical protein HGA65_10285, partial [Oscillochloris sp.]|nr:hypothetical protein [Oscillochloris sp.]